LLAALWREPPAHSESYNGLTRRGFRTSAARLGCEFVSLVAPGFHLSPARCPTCDATTHRHRRTISRNL